ncbi:MAG: LPP20 family lipoprotein [Nitrospirales bacterium]
MHVWLYFWISGCAWLGAEIPPEWMMAPHRIFPAERFLVGMGEAKDRDQAEQRAYAAVARIFSAKIQAQSMDRESYAMQETGKTSRTQRTLQLDHQTQVSTTKVLKNVKVLDVWYQPSTRQFFVLAGLDRQQAEQTIMDRLRNWDLTIGNMVEQGRTHPLKIQRIHGYKKAMSLLHDREQLSADLRVIRTSGKTHPPPYRIPDLQREFQDFVATELVISVSMKGENQEEMERAILEGLKREGLLGHTTFAFNEGMGGSEDVEIVGQTKLWIVDLPDPLFKYVRWCGDIDIYENPSHRLIGVIAKTGREGHITQQEAKVRASGAMQQVLSREVVRLLTESIFEEMNAETKIPRKSKSCP